MKLKLLNALLPLLVAITSIAYSQPAPANKVKSIILNDSTTCLPNWQIDEFIIDKIVANGLKKDTAAKAEKIRIKNDIIAQQDEHAKNLNSQLQQYKKVNTGLINDYNAAQTKLTKTQKQATNRGKAIWVLVGTTLLQIAIIILLIL